MLTYLIAAFLVTLDAILLWHLLTGAPFVPSKVRAIEKMLSLAEIKAGEKAVDLGSGDGRIVIAMARAGAEAHGYETNPLLVWWSRNKIRKAGLDGRAFIHLQNFWGADFSSYDVVALFGVTHIMKRLRNKFERELKPGARVVSNAFEFPGWTCTKKDDAVFCYHFSNDLKKSS